MTLEEIKNDLAENFKLLGDNMKTAAVDDKIRYATAYKEVGETLLHAVLLSAQLESMPGHSGCGCGGHDE